MAVRASLGFKLHTGWAMLVAVVGQPGEIQVLFRGRIELLPTDESVPRFVYHEAAQLPLALATVLLNRAQEASQKAARLAIQNILRDLELRGAKADVCGVLSGSTPVPDDLARILRSHPMIHAAEGALFQQAVVSACESCGLAVTAAREREIWSRVATAWGLAEPDLRKEIDALRSFYRVPWKTALFCRKCGRNERDWGSVTSII